MVELALVPIGTLAARVIEAQVSCALLLQYLENKIN
jgi:hypothetical protein